MCDSTRGCCALHARSSRAQVWQLRREFVHARAALLALRLQDASRAMVQLGELLQLSDPVLASHYRPALDELRACVLVAQDDLGEARELLAGSQRARTRGTLSATLVRYVDWMTGTGEEPPVPVARCTRGRTSRLERMWNLCLDAALELEHLRPTLAWHLAAEALRMAIERYGAASPAASLPAVLLAQIVYEQGRLQEAEDLIRPRAALILGCGTLECVWRASIVLARLSMHHGRHAEALAALREAQSVARTRGWTRLASAMRAEHRRIRPVAAVAVGSPPREAGGEGGHSRWELNLQPRYSSLQSALARLTSHSTTLETEDRFRLLIAYLRIGATRGLYRIFVDTAAPLLQLLNTRDYNWRVPDEPSLDLRCYIELLLRAATPTELPSLRTARRAYQRLSSRESVILRMIGQGMSNKQIALCLGIGPETVKSHTKRIFLKLGSRTRAQAVARGAAVDAGLTRERAMLSGDGPRLPKGE